MRSLRSVLGLSDKQVNRTAASRSGAMIEGLESRELFSASLLHAATVTTVKAAPKASVVAASPKVSAALDDNDGYFYCGTKIPHGPIPHAVGGFAQF